jgi:ABC-2 type transport system permease protein
MDARRTLRANAAVQVVLVIVIAGLVNLLASRHFLRVDLTEGSLYSLDIATRALAHRVEKPLIAKVFFDDDLPAPDNNLEQSVLDKLEELRAYSGGFLDIQVTDPGNDEDKVNEAKGFGIVPVPRQYRSQNRAEVRHVFMGLALVYGEKQEVLPAITQTDTLEYDLARALKNLVSDEDRRMIGFSAGHGEPDLGTATGPLLAIRDKLTERYQVASVPLGGRGMIPDDVDAMFVVGPQTTLNERAIYQLDQFLMRGGSLALFISNTKPDFRVMRPLNVYHGLDTFLGHLGVQVNRDLVVDRTSNGVMRLPVVQGNRKLQVNVNYPLIPQATDLSRDSLVVKDLDAMLFPFVSSLELVDPAPDGVTSEILARSSATSTRLKGLTTIDPTIFQRTYDSEEKGPWPLIVSMTGTWRSIADGGRPPEPDPEIGSANSDPNAPPDTAFLRDSAPTRVVVAGSADFVANNVPFVLNLADWLVQDENLIAIRSKQVRLAELRPMTPSEVRKLKTIDLATGPLALFLFGVLRFVTRRNERERADAAATVRNAS